MTRRTSPSTRLWSRAALSALSLGLIGSVPAAAADFLPGIHHHKILGSTVPENGDQNPYAVIVAPFATGKIAAGDVLIDNFNDKNNLQGRGTTIMRYRPATKDMALFAQFPADLAGCPGGVGLTAAMAVLKSGWVITGSTPSKDGMTGTKGKGCLLVTDAEGKLVDVVTGPNIDGPWGNMAVIDRGETASLFVSNAGFDVGAPGQAIQHKATVVRLDLILAPNKPPVIAKQTVIADGLGEQADKDVFLIGPTGLALARDGTLYVSDALADRIAAIPDAATRTDSAGIGTTISQGGLLHRPLALAVTPGDHLLVTNGLNGQIVEIDPATAKQLGARWIDKNEAQTPPGSGDLFGFALTPDGKGFYYVEDEVNMLVLAQ